MKNYFIILITLIFPILGYSNGLTVAVLDTGLNAPASFTQICGQYNFTTETDFDHIGHGTNVIGLIAKNAKSKDYCIYNIKGFDYTNPSISVYLVGLRQALKLRPDVVNISAGGFFPDTIEKSIILKMLDSGIRVVVAAGNNEHNLDISCNFFPACYDSRIEVIGNTGAKSNYGKIVDVVIDGENKTAFGITKSGSSQSTAIYTGRLIKELLKWVS